MGCQISEPISPPSHPLLSGEPRRLSDSHGTPDSSSSSLSSRPVSMASSKSAPIPPSWARPPPKPHAPMGRKRSCGGALCHAVDCDNDVFEADDEPEGEGDAVELIQGCEGRIAVRSTPITYEVLAWLPGFSVDNITLSTRRKGTLRIVANQWDEADHAQWDIKLAEDADLASIRAKFEQGELHILVKRNPRPQHGIRSASPVSVPALLSTPNVSGTIATAGARTTSVAAATQALARAAASASASAARIGNSIVSRGASVPSAAEVEAKVQEVVKALRE